MRLRDYYFKWVVAVYALYLFFNKGISYSFLSEITWLFGIVLVIRERNRFEMVWDRRVKSLALLLILTFLWVLRGLLQFPALDVIRDSFIFNYSFLIVIPFLYLESLQEFTNKIFSLYAWLPLVATLSFLLTLLVPSVMQWELFGKIPLFEYKRGDLGVQLLICAVLMLSGKIKLEPRWQILNYILIGYLFLVVATLNRGGMLSFLVGGALFVYLNRHTASLQQYRFSLRYVPLLLVLIAGLYAITRIEDTVQGRNSGFGQIGQNVASIVDRDVEGALSGNIVWRLAWWGTILDYTMAGPYFLQGKGLGINLAIDDGIPLEEDGEKALLRSPHNFHLTI